MSTLLSNYLKIEPKLETVYVYPSFDQKVLVNDYLQLLYHPLLKNDFNVNLKSISINRFPLLFFKRIKGEKIILHHHWYEANNAKKLFQLLWRTFWIIIFRMVGGKVVWTVHNKYPHVRKYLKLNKFLRTIFAKIATKLHVHCDYAVGEMSQILKVKKNKFFVVEHPFYRVNIIEREKAIKELRICYPELLIETSDIVFLAFGQIAPYKGLLSTIELFTQLEGNFKLIIAGKTKKGSDQYTAQLKKLAEKDERIFILNKFIDDKETDLLFNSANYAIFNFTDILTSGGVMLALSYKKSVIIPNIGCLKDLQGESILKFNTISELEEILRNIIQRNKKYLNNQ